METRYTYETVVIKHLGKTPLPSRSKKMQRGAMSMEWKESMIIVFT